MKFAMEIKKIRSKIAALIENVEVKKKEFFKI